MDQNELVNRIIQRMPHPDRITFDNNPQERAVRFSWQGKTFRVSDTLFVEEVQGGCLAGTSEADLIEHLLKGLR